MRTSLLSLIVAAGLMTSMQAQSLGSILMDFNIGVLRDSTGQPLRDGSLIQIIASPDVAFSQPTSASFLGQSSNDILLWSTWLDSPTTGVSGAAMISLPLIDLNTSPVANNFIVIRWFPTLTTNSSAPGFSTYGEYGYGYPIDATPDNPAWVVGEAGSYISYEFQTTSYFGSIPDSLGLASKSIVPIPEPHGYFGAAFCFFVLMALLIKCNMLPRVSK